MKALICLMFLIMTIAHPGPALAQELITDLSDHQVAIESTFTGTEILIFGAIETNDPEIRRLPKDIIVAVKGPDTTLTIRRKRRIFGIWVNYDTLEFAKTPSFLAVVATRLPEAIAKPAILRRHGLSPWHLPLMLEGSNRRIANSSTRKAGLLRPAVQYTPADIAEFRESIIRLKQQAGLYSEQPGGVIFLGDTLFRATVKIPANVPVGIYRAEVYLLRDGEIIHAQSSPFYINKTGFERFVFNLAQKHSFIYGLIAVAIALLAGWGASNLFRRS